MAFFSKLKDRLFKSSSKLEEGLDAIVQDGGAADPDEAPATSAAPSSSSAGSAGPATPSPDLPPQSPPGGPAPDLPPQSPPGGPAPDLPPVPAPGTPPPDTPPSRPDPGPAPGPDLPPATPGGGRPGAARAGVPGETPEPDLPPSPARPPEPGPDIPQQPDPVPTPEPDNVPPPADPQPSPEPLQVPPSAYRGPGGRAGQAAETPFDAASESEPTPAAPPPPDRTPPAAPPETPAPELPAPGPTEVPPAAPDLVPVPPRRDAAPAPASPAGAAAAASVPAPAHAVGQGASPTPTLSPNPSPDPDPVATGRLADGADGAASVADATPPPARGGLIGRLFGRRETAAPVIRRALDDDMIEQLEELLIASDMGVDTALRVTANMAEGRMGRRLSTDEIKSLISAEIARIMEPVARPMPLFAKKPQVVLVVGVNGSGKTTTIGKLASQFRAAGKSVIIAAGDTFRAAAVEQLEIWGERAGVPVMKAAQGTDPASLAFDAMARAEAEGADLLMIDTAGRLQNRADLMEELAKIVRVIRKRDPSAPHNTLLVLDATTGQNALSQVETFRRLADVSGLVMTKLDGTAKGGVLVALADRFGLPIHAIGVGEQIDDLAPFDPEEFARALTGAAA